MTAETGITGRDQQAITLEQVASSFDLLVCFSAYHQQNSERSKLQNLDLHCPLMTQEKKTSSKQPWSLDRPGVDVPLVLAHQFHAFLVRSQLPYNVLLHASASMHLKSCAPCELLQTLLDALSTPISFRSFFELRYFLRRMLPYTKRQPQFAEHLASTDLVVRRHKHVNDSLRLIGHLFGLEKSPAAPDLQFIYSEFLPRGSGLGVKTPKKYVVFVYASPSFDHEDEERNIVTHEALHYVLDSIWKTDKRLKKAISSTQVEFYLLDLDPKIRALYTDWSTYLQEVIIRAAVPHINQERPFEITLPLELCWQHYFEHKPKDQPINLAAAVEQACRFDKR